MLFFLLMLIQTANAATRVDVIEAMNIPAGFSVLRESPTCRASRTLAKGALAGTLVCFSTPSWNTWLRLSADENSLTRLHLQGKWELRILGKQEQRVFKVSLLKPVKSDSTFLEKMKMQGVQWIERQRFRFSERFSSSDRLGVFRRLLIDERPASHLTEQHELIRELGFVHLLNPSGLHLYSLARWVFFFTQSMVLLFGISPVPSRRFSGALTLCVVGWSWALTGFRWGLLRPLVMITVSEGAKISGFNFRKGSSLLLAVMVDLLVEFLLTWNGDPASFAMGRAHYVLAVGGGLLAMGERKRSSSFFAEFQLHMRLAVGSWLTTALYDVFMHSGISLATPILSLITVPVLSGLVYPVFLFSTFLKSSFSWIEHGMVLLTDFIQAISNMIFHSPVYFWIPQWALGVGAVAALFLFFFKVRKSKFLIFASLVFLIRVAHDGGNEGNTRASAPMTAVQIEQLNVGQGDAALITMRRGFGFLDTGSLRAKSLVSWLHFFSERGILNLDFVALTHLDEDHAGATSKIADLLPIQCVVTSERQWRNERGERFAKALKVKGTEPVNWKSGCFPFSYSAPEDRDENRKLATNRSRANSDMSAVWIPVRSEKRSFDYVSLGDADEKDELKMLPWLLSHKSRSSHASLVFKVSHHGSKTSSSEKMLQALQPDEAWISFGVGNRYGHPALQILDKLTRNGIPVKTTVSENITF